MTRSGASWPLPMGEILINVLTGNSEYRHREPFRQTGVVALVVLGDSAVMGRGRVGRSGPPFTWSARRPS